MIPYVSSAVTQACNLWPLQFKKQPTSYNSKNIPSADDKGYFMRIARDWNGFSSSNHQLYTTRNSTVAVSNFKQII